MRILVACEFSGTVRDAFRAKGHDAISCDLLPCEAPGPHIQGDVRDLLHDGWDMLAGFPPCTFVCSSSLHWIARDRIEADGRHRREHYKDAVAFFRLLHNAPIHKICLENPIGALSTEIREPDQIIQPWQFGHDASKSTCLWLKNLLPLRPTSHVQPRRVGGELDLFGESTGKARFGNQTDSGQNKLPPSPDRWALRSLTYPGIAAAMADQWG